ncbi:MAG: peptidase [Planctomycetaceae bacterium]|nr:MAG: peptidase [Planctomycetaceae bacterium]
MRNPILTTWLTLSLLGLSLHPPIRCPITLFADEPAAVQAEAATEAPVKAAKPLRSAVMIRFHEAISPLSGALLKRRFEQAVRDGAEVIVLDIDSPGGDVITTLDLVQMVERATDVHVVAYINREAISGAAILALSTDQIVMLPRARIGDAGMIVMGPDSAFRYASEKARSLLALQLRDLAEKHGRPAALAEAMVDKDLVISKATHKEDGTVRYFSNRDWDSMEDADQWQRGVVVREAPGNTFFTANGERAVELGLAELVIDRPEQLAGVLGVAEPIRLINPSGADTLIVILNDNWVTWLLLVIGLIALVIELGAPGIGVGGLISILCFGLFFWSRFLGGTSGWFEVILFLIGIAFIGLEILVIPGVGIAGVSGVLLVLFSLVMASRRVMMPESSRDLSNLMGEIGVVLAAFVGFGIGLAILARYLGELPLLSRLALAPMTGDGAPPVASLAGTATALPNHERAQIGDLGKTLGPLRPSGKLQLDDDILEVVTEGDFIPDGTEVRVVAIRGARVVVRRVEVEQQ